MNSKISTTSEISTVKPTVSLEDGVLPYTQLERNCCTSFRAVSEDIGTSITRCNAHILERNNFDLWSESAKGRAVDTLELGMRLWSGCGGTKNIEGAMDMWRKLSDPTHPNFLSTTSRRIKAKALSCLANEYLERSNADRNVLQIDNLYRAAFHADSSAALGLVTPNVLSIGRRVEQLGLRRQADCKYRTDTKRFEILGGLWEVYDARIKEMQLEDERRETKMSQNPHLYQCGAEGCGLEATSKSGLKRCAGNCPADLKPSYCSKECQRADWKRHKGLCTGTATTENASSKDETPLPTSSSKGLTVEESMKTDGRELRMEVPAPGLPGGKMVITSTTMNPQFMKEMRETIEEHAQTHPNDL